jgi:capsular exopolysaccharide synthesis family protein
MQYEKLENKPQTEDFIRVQDLWLLFISNWQWFVVSVVAALLIAGIYLATTPSVYTRTGSILIKDTKNSNSAGADDIFATLGITQTNININNELLTFKSPILMTEVVRRLSLDVDYSLKGFFSDKALYNQTPAVISLDSVNRERSFSCYLELLPDNKVKLYEFAVGGQIIDEPVTGNLSEYLNTPAGQIQVTPTGSYSENYYNRPIIVSKVSEELMAKIYAGAVNVALNDEKATVLDFALSDVSGQRAEDILRTLFEVYNENWIEDKNKVAKSTSKFISERLAIIEGELGDVDDIISRFKSSNMMPDIQMASSMYMAQSSENSAKILSLSTQRSIAQSIYNHLRDSIGKEQLLPFLGLENASIGTQINEYNTMLNQRNRLLMNSSENNPLVVDLNRSLKSVRQSILNSMDNMLMTLDTQIAGISHSERQTSRRIASSPDQEKYLTSVQRQQKVKETLYLFLLQKREENELSQAFIAYNTKVIVSPSGSPFPSSPRRLTILLAAVVIGLVLPCLVLYLKEVMNTKVRGRKDLDVLSFPFIGEIPQIRAGKEDKRFYAKFLRLFDAMRLRLGKKDEGERHDIVVEDKNKNYMNEAFRIVRTNLDFMEGASEQAKVVLFTSLNIGSGKTFTSVNLAISMAIKNKKVALIDLDMRKASLSKYVGSPTTGISNYLGKMQDDPAKIIVKGRLHPNLDIIPVGIIPPNPAELLLDERLETLLNQLREQYDYIFLDCTPVKMVADASIVAKLSDLTVFIVRSGLMDKRALPDVEEFRQEGALKSMAVILNGVDYRTNRYGYQKYGYYGYEYGE